MNTATLTAFFMWCTLINGALLIIWTLALMLAPDLVYRTQSRWFPISRESFDLVIYGFIGLFKIFFLMFNLAPYIALLLVG